MKEFLNDYVRMLAEAREQEFTEEEFNKLVNSLMNDDSLWDMFDGYIYDELDDMKGE